MSTPSFTNADNGAGVVVPHLPVSATTDGDNIDDIPRRQMRVKVLYTFDDDNKSNCLARLPNALSVPVVALDETTQVGVIELKTCIQAIVAASPELVAKLGHDYTVYAYDFSEYETPLVGQGMLSWILASASNTPNAPAEQSQTMVTGRVCKNILGLFSNGVKETLEVKLKLVPVPTCMQREYLDNMERYHSLSKLMPTGLDYSAWADFLKANPTIGQLAQPDLDDASRDNHRPSIGGVEQFHQMLARPSPAHEPIQNEFFYDQSFSSQPTRASSPAMSTVSFHHYQYKPDSRPVSRASFRSEAQSQSQQFHLGSGFQEQQEEGPAKKRARIEKAKRPKRTALITNNESLRVTASTAASVRLHKPIATNPASALASADQIPRAPTPRPGDANRSHSRARSRPSAPSLLRHASMNEGNSCMSPYDSAASSDNAIESSDDERGGSPGETPMDIPSSPPFMPQRTVSPAPSSPVLPTASLPADSGFVSDMPLGRDEEEGNQANKIWDGSDLPTPADVRIRPRQDRSHHPWQEVNPGPVELLPKSYVPRPKTNSRPRPMQPITESIEQQTHSSHARLTNEQMNQGSLQNMAAPASQTACNAASPPMDSSFGSVPLQQHPSASRSTTAGSPEGMGQNAAVVGDNSPHVYSRSATPSLPQQQAKLSKARGLPRSHTWSGAGDAMSDAPAEGKAPRSGSGAKRKKCIKEKLEEAIAAGKIPPHCNNCGEIETPTWRKAYTRIENGSPPDLQLPENSGIIAFEVIEPTEENANELKHRIFRTTLGAEEKASETHEVLNLCNPCGLWLMKKGAMRPQKQWEKAAQQANDNKPKRKRNPPKGTRKKAKGTEDDLMSDAVVPYSEPIMPGHLETPPTAFDGSIDGTMQPPVLARASSVQNSEDGRHLQHDTAQAALQRAIQSSPAGFRGSKESPIDVEPDLTPKPTRRLLFPSPRKDGEVKSLGDGRTSVSPSTKQPTFTKRPLEVVEGEDIDKENCPPPIDADDEFAHLFESPKITPKKNQPFQDLLKTPTPGSRSRRVPLTPKQGGENGDLPLTPSRILLTPRTNRGATLAPETPFTRQLNALLSDCMPSSPSHGIDFSTFPTFNTPGRNQSNTQFAAFMNDDFLSSDMPVPSSPPHGGLGFDLYEDPNTSTVGLWSGASIFGSDAIIPEGNENGGVDGESPDCGEATVLRMNVGGISVDFAAMIEDVSGRGSSADTQDQSQSPSQPTSPVEEGQVKQEPVATPA